MRTKVEELRVSYAMSALRKERNKKLGETDFYALKDVNMSEEVAAYRQALRDLPASSTNVTLVDGKLIGVVWPNEPPA